MLARLRQLGVSFISAEDLQQLPRAEEDRAPAGSGQPCYNSIFLPRATTSTQSVWSNASPDSSLEINSLALKYLDDAQLSKLADQHRINPGTGTKENRNGEVRKGGRSVDLSLATQEFLWRHGLATSDSQRAPLRVMNGCDQTPASSDGGAGGVVQRGPPFRQQLTAQKLQSVNHLANRVQSPPFLQHVGGGGWTGEAAVPQPAARPPVPRPEISNRILDITAIRQQPKLL